MEDSRQDLQELIVLKAKLETALEKEDREEIKRTYDEFKNLYKKLTGKEFEDGIDPEKLAQIEAVITGVIPDKNINTDERYEDLDL